jgi:hypothetical protein
MGKLMELLRENNNIKEINKNETVKWKNGPGTSNEYRCSSCYEGMCL